MADNLTDFTLPKTSYASFDALTLKQLIINRLNQGGVFTDQNYEGSNLSALNDIIALSYHYLLFYLNQTSGESMFNEATIYENMNRIVKLIQYKPAGYKTSLLSFQSVAPASLPTGIYTIPRYSYFTINGIIYSFINDATFTKTTSADESIPSLFNENLLYQGSYVEYPGQVATGENFETFTVVVKDTVNNIPVNIDQNSINVYVKDINSGNYTQFNLTNSLFLESSTSTAYELRYNENGFYEIKFGNGVFGQVLNAGDIVYVYYIQSDGQSGVISANQLNGNTLNLFTSPQFLAISNNVFNQSINYITAQEASTLSFTNDLGSSPPGTPETVNEIRNNSPKTFYSQNRLITEQDFTNYITTNFSNIVISSKVVNNNSFIENYIKYFYDLGITRPNDDPRYAYNQVNFSHSGQDNNIYLFMVPKIQSVDANNVQHFLQNSQKNAIISSMTDMKALNMELVPQDPVYQAFTLGLTQPGETPTTDIAGSTYLVIKRTNDIRIDSNSIKDNINTIFQNYFSSNSCTLGQTISLNDITSLILSVNGVNTFYMKRVLSDGTVITSNGLTLLTYNPNYSDVDIQVITSNLQLPYYKFPYLYNQTILNNIIVE
jgi:hypothetical protein